MFDENLDKCVVTLPSFETSELIKTRQKLFSSHFFSFKLDRQLEHVARRWKSFSFRFRIKKRAWLSFRDFAASRGEGSEKRETTSNYTSIHQLDSLFRRDIFALIAYFVSIACLLCVDTTVYILITQRLITELMSRNIGAGVKLAHFFGSFFSYLITN